ncbi:IDEAL domain-containing protein [Staphylococcus coagulans]|uniref:IDEAL domain-containing protein n=1 Tax=Staphylococcus coagulans TaxID=74706 RepID=UPI0030EB69EC
MENQTDVKRHFIVNSVHTINQLGVELVIEEALKNQRKRELQQLIDAALIDRNEQAFNMYTQEYLKLEEVNVG